MKYRLSSRTLRACFVAAGTALLTLLPLSPLPASRALADMLPVEVNAVYKITLNGFDLGSFRYTSSVTPDGYSLDSDVEISALLGAFHWKGVTHTSGSLAGNLPKPAGFMFDYESTTKDGSVKMGFNQTGVASVTVLPQSGPQPDVVPLQDQHLKNVLDPLSAILVLTQADGGNPCGRKVPIFDGKQRFDLQLSYGRQAAVGNGQQGMSTVCRVKYVPLGGYRANDETKGLANSTGIEITFRPVPSANLMVPHLVTIPTMAGSAELTLERVEIKTPGRGLIALVD